MGTASFSGGNDLGGDDRSGDLAVAQDARTALRWAAGSGGGGDDAGHAVVAGCSSFFCDRHDC